MKFRLEENIANSGTLFHGGFLDIRSISNYDPLFLCPKSELNYYGYRRKKYSVEYEINNPLIIDCQKNKFSNLPMSAVGENGFGSTDMIVDIAKQQGYDSIIFNDINDVNLTDELVLLYPKNQVKNIDELN